jgi:hypothetical protein
MKRPKIISLICILGFVSTIFTFPQVFSPSIKKMGILMPALYGILVASNFIACVGIWYFKKWGVQLFLYSFFAKTIFFILTLQTGGSFYLGIMIFIISLIFLIKYYPKMNANL